MVALVVDDERGVAAAEPDVVFVKQGEEEGDGSKVGVGNDPPALSPTIGGSSSGGKRPSINTSCMSRSMSDSEVERQNLVMENPSVQADNLYLQSEKLRRPIASFPHC